MIVAVTAVFDAVASVIRHVHLQSGFDLAVFDQAVWHYSRFQAPFSSLKGEDLLRDHFHPLVAVLAPLYWVWSDPRMLLIAQAVLVAASVIPVFLFVCSKVGRGGAYMLTGAYAAFWGIQVGVLFDFHEVAFAPLLIALTILLADRKRWGWFWLVVALTLCVKEDLSFYVIFFGIYLLTVREFRHGIALIGVGAAWYELATRVFIPHFAGGAAYTYWSYGELGKTPLPAIWALIQAPWRVITLSLSPAEKAHTLVALFAPYLFLSVGSRLIILAIPLLAERFLSTNSQFWSMHFHYSLAVAPVLAMSAAAGLAHLARLTPERLHRTSLTATTAVILLASLLITRFDAPDSALTQMTRAAPYNTPSFAPGGLQALPHVPANASLATTDALLPHASERDQIQLLDPESRGRDQYLIANVLHPGCCGDSGNTSYAALGSVLDQELPHMTPVFYDSGWLVARRPPSGQQPANGTLTPMTPTEAVRVEHATAGWRSALAAAYTRLTGCYRDELDHQPKPAGCSEAALTSYPRWLLRLSSAINSAKFGLSGGCAQLANSAATALALISHELQQLSGAERARASGPTASAFRTYITYELSHDPIGLLNRFEILCTPR